MNVNSQEISSLVSTTKGLSSLLNMERSKSIASTFSEDATFIPDGPLDIKNVEWYDPTMMVPNDFTIHDSLTQQPPIPSRYHLSHIASQIDTHFDSSKQHASINHMNFEIPDPMTSMQKRNHIVNVKTGSSIPDSRDDVLASLEIHPDKLRDSATGDYRSVYSCIRPIVCYKTDTSFYSQCSTAKMGFCTRCQSLRPGNQKQGSFCVKCGDRLTAKYHRWYHHLLRLEPLEQKRREQTYELYKPVFEKFGITWKNDYELKFVLQNYMLMKIYLSSPNVDVEPLHLERTYMVGVFAGREFNTGTLARNLLRDGCGLSTFRAAFPKVFESMHNERVSVAEQMNQALFGGSHRAYFHAHHGNIEGWYDARILSRNYINQLFKDLCDRVLRGAPAITFPHKREQTGFPQYVAPSNRSNYPNIFASTTLSPTFGHLNYGNVYEPLSPTFYQRNYSMKSSFVPMFHNGTTGSGSYSPAPRYFPVS